MPKPDAHDKQRGMVEYTKWWIAHPWHVTGTPESGRVPPDCDCTGCTEERAEDSEHKGRVVAEALG